MNAMSPYPTEQPFPEHTPPPPTPPRAKRKRSLSRSPPDVALRLYPRQLADQSQVGQAQAQCQDTLNSQLSCFPTSDTQIPQHEWAAFVWNTRTPFFTQTKLVNVYLHQADSRQIIAQWLNQPSQPNQSGVITSLVNDTWWPGSRGSQWNGSNINFEYYWVITRNDHVLDGSEQPQSTFTAVQTTFADSIVASMASTSSAASASSASASSASAASSRSAHGESSSGASGSGAASGGSATSSGSGNSLQGNASGSSFPHWAIAVIVVLGLLAIVACCILVFLLLRRYRQNRATTSSNRGSMGSASPMMANAAQDPPPHSPLLGAAVAEKGAEHERERPEGARVVSDGASTASRAHSLGDGPFSGADAAIMADAFRTALRKPDFAGRPVEEGESPGSAAERAEQARLNLELAEEGRDIRSVASSRGVKVERTSENGGSGGDEDTVQDH